MLKLFVGMGLAAAASLQPLTATAAKIDTKDVSNVTLTCGFFGHHDWCSRYPNGTINMTVTPEDGETPDSVAEIYVVAVYGGKFYVYNTQTTDPALQWKEVPSDQLPTTPTFTRAPFDSPAMNRPIYMGSHAQLKGIALYAGVSAKGKIISTAHLKRVWANP